MKRWRRHENRRGTAVVEMALVLPIFFTVVLGIIEFGRAMMVAQILTNAARLGAREAIIDGATETEVKSTITDFLCDAAGVTADQVGIGIVVSPNGSSTATNLATAQTSDLVDVEVEVAFDDVSFIAGDYLSGHTLSGKAAMRHE